jgi:hypothetical protein
METANLFGMAVRNTNLASRNVKNAIMLDLESTEFYPEFGKATSRKPSTLSKSILSRRNFLKIES